MHAWSISHKQDVQSTGGYVDSLSLPVCRCLLSPVACYLLLNLGIHMQLEVFKFCQEPLSSGVKLVHVDRLVFLLTFIVSALLPTAMFTVFNPVGQSYGFVHAYVRFLLEDDIIYITI